MFSSPELANVKPRQFDAMADSVPRRQSSEDRSLENESHDRKRQRTAHACDACRLRKIRCDGRRPCQSCSAKGMTQEECAYGSEAIPKGKSDLILNTVLRMESVLNKMAASTSTSNGLPFPVEQSVSPEARHSINSDHSHHRVTHSPEISTNNMHNAILAPLHTSATESVLKWPNFDAFPTLRFEEGVSIFHLEQLRSPVLEKPNVMYPYVSGEIVDHIIEAFQQNINFWYPTLSKSKIRDLKAKITSGDLDQSCHSCLALLLMALGCACDSIATVFKGEEVDIEDSEYQHQRRRMAESYFDGAMKRLHTASFEISTDAAQCFLFTSFYFVFQQRPLQAWSQFNATATKCHLLISYTPSNATLEDVECIRRLFWSCYILESDYLAELSALPKSGIADIESSVPLPGNYDTHDSIKDQELSSLYFLACLSIRRLLNRVHHILYAKDTGAGFDDARFPHLVTELDHQLEQWREHLPPAFQFSVDLRQARSQHASHLRQRYLTCRSVIYRPYLTKLLIDTSFYASLDTFVLEKAEVCLDACLLHILNLRGNAHTVMMDTWICSLSMAGAMLIILAAYRLPRLRQRIKRDVTSLGQHLKPKLERWMRVPGQSVSPSVEQSLRLIMMADGFIRREHANPNFT